MITIPKSTFINLPEAKKQRILAAAVDEFAEYSYYKASITRIVNRAEIAKGSFYQYFTGKKDLYKYMIEKSGEKKLHYLEPVMNKFDELDFFDIVREMYTAAIEFKKENPKLGTIGEEFMKSNNDELKMEILGENTARSDQFFKILIKKGIENENLKSDIDVDLASYLITSLSIAVSDYFFNRIKNEDDIEIMPMVNSMLEILKNGMSK